MPSSKKPFSNVTYEVYKVPVVVEDFGNNSPLDHWSNIWMAYKTEVAYIIIEKNPLIAD